MAISTGAQVARYRIIQKLGAGGMGEVYLAEDVSLGRKAAIKILPEHYTQDADRVRRFTQEARIAARIEVDLPRPRSVASTRDPGFSALFDRIYGLLRDEVMRAMVGGKGGTR